MKWRKKKKERRMRERESERLIDFFTDRMTVLGRGLIF